MNIRQVRALNFLRWLIQLLMNLGICFVTVKASDQYDIYQPFTVTGQSSTGQIHMLSSIVRQEEECTCIGKTTSVAWSYWLVPQWPNLMELFNWINKITVYLVTRWKEIWYCGTTFPKSTVKQYTVLSGSWQSRCSGCCDKSGSELESLFSNKRTHKMWIYKSHNAQFGIENKF